MNEWVENHTFDLIQDFADKELVNPDQYYVIVNTLAIDMDWQNRLQPGFNSNDILYRGHFNHENYYDSVISVVDNESFGYIDFNGNHYKGAEIGASANRYNLIDDYGEENVRKILEEEYQKWLDQYPSENYNDGLIDRYVQEIKDNYNQHSVSTDFQFYVDDSVKVFAKDLKEYDGTSLQYVAIMPSQDLENFIQSSDADSLNNLLSNLKDADDINSYSDGVITKVIASMPFFEYECELDLKNEFKSLGIQTVFSENADLSNLMKGSSIGTAMHKDKIELSNEGMKAGATTGMGGGATGGMSFYYDFDVPVEIIDLEFNQPFVYMIRDKENGDIWFMGKMYKGIQSNSSREVNENRR